MLIDGIIATSRVGTDGYALAREALEDVVKQINGDEKLLINAEHNPLDPPLGKYLSAHLEKRADGEYAVVGLGELFEIEDVVRLPDGSVGIRARSGSDNHPFAGISRSTEFNGIQVGCEETVFASAEDQRSFIRQIESEAAVPVCHRQFLQRSATPEPQLIITVTAAVIGAHITARFAGEVAKSLGSEVGKDIAGAYRTLASVIAQYGLRIHQGNRRAKYVINVAGVPTIQFAARTSVVSVIIQAIRPDIIGKCISEADSMAATYEADLLQFILNDRGEWQFNYMLTTHGEVIGTPAAMSRRTQHIQLARKRLGLPEQGLELEESGIHSEYDEPDQP